MKFPDGVYNKLKWICLIVIPAINTFLLTVLPVIGVADKIIGVTVTISSAIGTLIGALIGVSTKTYYDSKKE